MLLTILLALCIITTALLFGAYRFINGVLDYAGDTREDFDRAFANADDLVVRGMVATRGGKRAATEQDVVALHVEAFNK